MPDSVRDIQGKIKEKAGEATDDDRLKHEGQVEQGGERVKQGVDAAVDKTKQLLKDE